MMMNENELLYLLRFIIMEIHFLKAYLSLQNVFHINYEFNTLTCRREEKKGHYKMKIREENKISTLTHVVCSDNPLRSQNKNLQAPSIKQLHVIVATKTSLIIYLSIQK